MAKDPWNAPPWFSLIRNVTVQVINTTCIWTLTCISDSPKELKKQKRTLQSPKTTSQPRRRSSRLSPQNENKDQTGGKVGEERILKPRCVNSANWQFTHQSKDFKVPSKTATSKLRRTSDEKANSKDTFKQAQVLCPLRHGPKDVCTICMAR